MRARAVDGIERGAAVREQTLEDALLEQTLEDALPVWRELHEAMVERMRSGGWNTDHPLYDWSRVERSMREFHEKLTALQVQEAERRARSPDPVPDPDGRMIHPHELADAEERLMTETHQSGRWVPTTPRPERMPAAEREEARAAVERQNAIEVPDRDAYAYRLAPQESRLDWLNTAPTSREPEPQREDRLDSLGDRRPDQERRREPDRERER